MKILFVIPHYFGYVEGKKNASTTLIDPALRIAALERTILSLHLNFGSSSSYINFIDKITYSTNSIRSNQIDIFICTHDNKHIINSLNIKDSYYHHTPVQVDDPINLGFACRNILQQYLGKYDYYCYIEDDICIRDPYFFDKLKWFTAVVHPLAVLFPNRYEICVNMQSNKLYIDGISLVYKEQYVISSFLFDKEIKFILPPDNPHSGCYFINKYQLEYWIDTGDFENRDSSFVSPLESAATLSIKNNFQLYKPIWDNADFLEVEHFGSNYANKYLREIGSN